MENINNKIINEFNCDLKASELNKEDYIEEMESIINSVDFIDYSIYDVVFHNLGIDDKKLIEKLWKEWIR